ncbi:AI-2E family transporter [Cellulomonas sp. NS3]|uniref:AI-2E family transporter n=1 Tax=Cellulomonas sp. NS3 TaxID=2973977 RepID=UPI002162383E|nr:AI-2E family transporter [Cellulomonas sp. NS3]
MNAFRRRPGRAASSAALATTVPSPTHRPTPPPPTGPWHDGLGRAATRSAQALLVLALASVLVWGLTQVKLLVIPLLIAAILAAAFSPLVRLFRRWGWPRALATWAALLLGLGTLGVVLWLVGRGIRKEWPTLVEEADRGLGELEKFLLQGPLEITEEQIASAREALTAALTSDQVQSGAITGATAAAEGVAGLLLGVVVLFFLMKDGRSIFGFLIRPLSEERQARAWRVGNRSVGVLGGYVRGTAIVAFVDALVIGLALVILGVPLALPLATIVFLGAFVPLIGATVAGILATLVALVTNGPTTALIVLVVVIAVNQLEGDLLAPVVIGRALALHPLAILLALTAGTILSGIIGALLAVPITAVAWAAITEWRAPEGDGPGGGTAMPGRVADARR